MADKWGALAQIKPVASTLTDAYAVPLSRRATVEVIICNQGGAGVVRLSHAIAGAVDAGEQYLLYDFSLEANVTKVTEQITADATDIIRVYSDSGDVVFNINGIEEDD